MQNIIPLTVIDGSGDPSMAYVPFDKLEDIDVSTSQGNQMRIAGERKTIAEHPLDLEALADQESVDPFIVQRRDIDLQANLAVQATGLAITKFLSEFTTVTGTTDEAATLDAATVGKVRVVINNDANTDLLLFPAVGEFHNGVAVNLSIDVGFGERVTLYCKTAGTWLLVPDNG